MQRSKEPKSSRVQAGVQLGLELWKQARILAIKEGTSAGLLIDEALRDLFAKRKLGAKVAGVLGAKR